MGKEFRFWQTERRVFADKLADEERLAGDPKGGENIGADLDSQIRQVCFKMPLIEAEGRSFVHLHMRCP